MLSHNKQRANDMNMVDKQRLWVGMSDGSLVEKYKAQEVQEDECGKIK